MRCNPLICTIKNYIKVKRLSKGIFHHKIIQGGGKVNEFRVECYVSSDDMQKTKLSNLDKKDIDQWKRDIEARGLSEYYHKKVKVSKQKI